MDKLSCRGGHLVCPVVLCGDFGRRVPKISDISAFPAPDAPGPPLAVLLEDMPTEEEPAVKRKWAHEAAGTREELNMHHDNRTMTEQMRHCIHACVSCAQICDRCADDMIGMSGGHDKELQQLCIRLCEDCADLCTLSARWMSRLSPSAEMLCRVCADLCDRCAEICEQHAPHHRLCGDCATECHRCAGLCRDMAGAMA